MTLLARNRIVLAAVVVALVATLAEPFASSALPPTPSDETLDDGQPFVTLDKGDVAIPPDGEFRFTVAAKTGLVRIWVLLPAGRPHGQFELYRSPIGRPETTEMVHATTTVEVPRGYIATFQMVNPPEGFRYEVRWPWAAGAASPR